MGRSAVVRAARSRALTRSRPWRRRWTMLVCKVVSGNNGGQRLAHPREEVGDGRPPCSGRIDPGQERLDLAHRHLAGMQREDLIVEAGEPACMLGNQARLKGPSAIAGTSIASGPSSVR